MKYFYTVLFLVAVVYFAKAQKPADFEDVELEENSYWNGSDESGEFRSSNLTFKNTYSLYGEYESWSGFACSNITDNITPGYANQYSAITGSGYDGSANYAVAYIVEASSAEFDEPGNIRGLYITNSTYTYYSMQDGDSYAKKFGGESGSDPDYLKVYIEGVDSEGEPTDTVEFYLADFRFEESSSDYLINDWQWVDLAPLGEIKTINFWLESSDNGIYGMNTPAYFCIDNVNGSAPVVLNDIEFAGMQEMELEDDLYYNGSDYAGGFYSGNFWFENSFSEGYWNGFAVSTMTDTQTAGWGNQYSAVTGGGTNYSNAYAIAYTGMEKAKIYLKESDVSGFYVSNSTYAYWSMKDGDQYSKKFGGESGTDPDWFKLTIEGFNETESKGTVEYYLADFRSDNSSEDYIVTDWQWVDLSGLGSVSRLEFILSSSDVGEYGINTPAYFVMDNLNKQIPASVDPGINEIVADVYPNPFSNQLNISLKNNAEEIKLYDITGKLIRQTEVSGNSIILRDLDDLHSGIYLLKIVKENQTITKKLIKK